MPPPNATSTEGTRLGTPQELAQAQIALREEQLANQRLLNELAELRYEKADQALRTSRRRRGKAAKAASEPPVGLAAVPTLVTQYPHLPAAPPLFGMSAQSIPTGFMPSLPALQTDHQTKLFDGSTASELKVLGKMLAVFTHPWWHTYDEIFTMDYKRVLEALDTDTAYDNNNRPPRDDKRVRLLIARDVLTALNPEFHPYLNAKNVSLISLLKEGSESMRSQAIYHAKHNRRTLLRDAMQDVLPSLTIPHHDIDNCLDEAHDVAMCPRFAALLSSPRLPDLLDFANGAQQCPTNAADRKDHIDVGSNGNYDKDLPPTPDGGLPIGTPDYPLFLFSEAVANIDGLFQNESLYRLSRHVLWGPKHRMKLLGKVKNGEFVVQNGANAYATAWKKSLAEPGVFVFMAVVLMCLCFGDETFRPEGVLSGYDYNEAATRWLLLLDELNDGVHDNDSSDGFGFDDDFGGTHFRQVFDKFNHHVFGHGTVTGSTPTEIAPGPSTLETGRQRRQMLVRAAIGSAKSSPPTAQSGNVLVPASSRRPSPPLASSRQPSPPLASSRRPSPPLAFLRQPSPPLASSRQPSPPLASSHQPTPPLASLLQSSPPRSTVDPPQGSDDDVPTDVDEDAPRSMDEIARALSLTMLDTADNNSSGAEDVEPEAPQRKASKPKKALGVRQKASGAKQKQKASGTQQRAPGAKQKASKTMAAAVAVVPSGDEDTGLRRSSRTRGI